MYNCDWVTYGQVGWNLLRQRDPIRGLNCAPLKFYFESLIAWLHGKFIVPTAAHSNILHCSGQASHSGNNKGMHVWCSVWALGTYYCMLKIISPVHAMETKIQCSSVPLIQEGCTVSRDYCLRAALPNLVNLFYTVGSVVEFPLKDSL